MQSLGCCPVGLGWGDQGRFTGQDARGQRWPLRCGLGILGETFCKKEALQTRREGTQARRAGPFCPLPAKSTRWEFLLQRAKTRELALGVARKGGLWQIEWGRNQPKSGQRE